MSSQLPYLPRNTKSRGPTHSSGLKLSRLPSSVLFPSTVSEFKPVQEREGEREGKEKKEEEKEGELLIN